LRLAEIDAAICAKPAVNLSAGRLTGLDRDQRVIARLNRHLHGGGGVWLQDD